MSERLIVLAHGIGDAKPDFYKEWEDVITGNHALSNVTVKGLWWEDVLQKVAEKYDVVSGTLAEIVAMCGFPDLEKWVGNDSWKLFKDYMMDLLVYAGLPDMWLMIQDECALKLVWVLGGSLALSWAGLAAPLSALSVRLGRGRSRSAGVRVGCSGAAFPARDRGSRAPFGGVCRCYGVTRSKLSA